MVYINRLISKHMTLYLMPKSREYAFTRNSCSVYTELSDESLPAYVAREGEVPTIIMFHDQ